MSETKEKAGKLKVKAKILKPKNLSNNDEPIKVDLSKPKTEEQDAIQVRRNKGNSTVVETSGIARNSATATKWTKKSSPIAEVQEEKPVIEEVNDEKPKKKR